MCIVLLSNFKGLALVNSIARGSLWCDYISTDPPSFSLRVLLRAWVLDLLIDLIVSVGKGVGSKGRASFVCADISVLNPLVGYSLV